jgi:hypothetical protein
MAQFILENAWCGGNVKCPHCNNVMDIQWETEYGDPVMGEHIARCMKDDCDKTFTFDVRITIASYK